MIEKEKGKCRSGVEADQKVIYSKGVRTKTSVTEFSKLLPTPASFSAEDEGITNGRANSGYWNHAREAIVLSVSSHAKMRNSSYYYYLIQQSFTQESIPVQLFNAAIILP